jgi:hypothetical protein
MARRMSSCDDASVCKDNKLIRGHNTLWKDRIQIRNTAKKAKEAQLVGKYF